MDGVVAIRRMDISEARSSPRERERIENLIQFVPPGMASALDVGARDGFLSVALTAKVSHVWALDLVAPAVNHPRVTSIAGDARRLEFGDAEFDVVLCAEVLEHIAPPELEQICGELVRVTRRALVIGVPFEQDTRVGRLTCSTCGHHNPPWGHVSTFDETRLRQLFSDMQVLEVALIGSNREKTNRLSTMLNDFAGNPWGTYGQQETCIRCGAAMPAPAKCHGLGWVASKLAHVLNRLQAAFVRDKPTWIHVLLVK